MAGIDNTILAEALLCLSPYPDQGRVWDTLEELIAAPPEEAEAILLRPRDQESSFTESTRSRFFNGLNKKVKGKSVNVAWWPEANRRYPAHKFDEMVETQFLWYATHPRQSPEEVWDTIRKVCEKYQVPRQEINSLRSKGGPQDWIREMIRLAKLAQSLGSTAQKSLRKQKPEAPPAPAQPYRLPPGTEADPPYGEAKQPVTLLEGKRLAQPHPDFLPWKEPENWSWVQPYSGSLSFSDGSFLDLPYLELFGGEAPGEAEFIEGENLFCTPTGTTAPLEEEISTLDYQEALAQEENAARALGHVHHPPKLWLDHLDYLEDAEHPGRALLTLHLGSSDYLGQRVYRREMAQNPQAQAAFQEVLAGLRGDAEHCLQQCPWASCGGGVWPVVRDGNGDPYVICSLRNPKKVAEVAGRLGYGASGSFDLSDGTPAQAMAREIQEELGLPLPPPQDLTLISLGVDTERYLIQFSYLWDTPYTLPEVRRYRLNRASTAGEQRIFFVPLARPVLESFLRQAAFEPGAAYSLMRLLQKRSHGPA